MPKVAVVVLHYVKDEMTNKCIDSMKEHVPFADIIVVDNCSPVPFKRDDVTVIRTEENRNVRGMNFGFSYALRRDYDYIANCDNDVIAISDWITPLVEVMEEDKTIGITGGKQWNESMTQFNSVGADLMGMVYRNTPEEKCSVVWMQGSVAMMRVEMMRKIGIHDERYETICSDCDYCLHARDRGWKVVFVPESEIIHLGNATYGGVPVDSEAKDKLNFMHKWTGLNFNQFVQGFPYDTMYHNEIIAGYNLNGEKRVFPVCVMPDRPSTLEAKGMFNGTGLHVVEVGSMFGNNAASLLRKLKIRRLDLIDNNHDGWINTLKKRFEDNAAVNVIEKDSKVAARDYEDESLDFVYIDADHSYDAVILDIASWYPKVKKGGLFAGHDYVKPAKEHEKEFDVITAVNDFFGEENITVRGMDWWIIKK